MNDKEQAMRCSGAGAFEAERTAGLLNLGNADILDQIILSLGQLFCT